MKKSIRFYSIIIMTILVFGSLAFGIGSEPENEELLTVGTKENLKKLIEEAMKKNSGNRYYLIENQVMVNGVEVQKEAASVPSADASNGVLDYSKTNIQVQGVDEADLVKTDGDYIYQISSGNLFIVETKRLKTVSILRYEDIGFYPTEMYIDKENLVLIGSTSLNNYAQNKTTCAAIYHIKDKNKVTKVRQVELKGELLTTRKIGKSLYLMTNQYISYYGIKRTEDIETPSYKDSVVSKEAIQVDCKDIRYFPHFYRPNYLVVAALDISSNKKMQLQAFLGSGENVYASLKHLYIAMNEYQDYYINSLLPWDMEEQSKTKIYKFALSGDSVQYIDKGEVPGAILNQFSMDEKGEYFRIATTTGSTWAAGKNLSKNNLYVLDSKMNRVGQIEDIAPGEKIYSVRFMGDRAYMVTFEKVDPLFVIDLKNPKKPEILGALKIPGYSDYLHPYDENHLLGFGKDTTVIKGNAYYKGMKIALFDVTDVKKPKEMFSTIIGDRGTDSEVLSNHKALLFSKEKNLLAFPVNVYEIQEQDKQGPLAYGQFVFNGAYVFQINLKKGFQIKAKITHLSDEDYLKAGNYYSYGDGNIQRIIYIGNKLYTISNNMIKEHDMTYFKETRSLRLDK